MSKSTDSRQQNGEFFDNDNTDQVNFDKKHWRTLLFVLTLLGATILMVFMLA
ncbi:MAG: hypothetical protein JXQ99_03555 [Hyphomicrobiaceae bacterium]